MIKKYGYLLLLLILGSIIFVPAIYADFDERYWEMYAEIQISPEEQLPSLGAIFLEPWYFENTKTKISFSDIRILSGNRVEVPYQIITRSPETKTEELTVRMLNLSQTKQKETYFEGFIEKTPVIYNMVEILSEERNFYRQVQLFGSMNAKEWNLIRSDAVIFDYSGEENLRHTKITFPDSHYRYLSIKIINNADKPIKITGLKVYYNKTDIGIEIRGNAFISKQETDSRKKESIIIVNLYPNFPVRKINLMASDKNFQRRVGVWVMQDSKEWIKWSDDMVFDFSTEKVKESKMDITIPEISAKELKFVIKNYDSPPLNITGINIIGYKKTAIFKLYGRQKYYMFWGNPQAKSPQYDLSQLIMKHTAKDIRLFTIGEKKKNPKFIGSEKRLPFTERYKYLLYGVIILVMAGLIILQYKVIKKTGKT